jgi:hypothetical protein
VIETSHGRRDRILRRDLSRLCSPQSGTASVCDLPVDVATKFAIVFVGTLSMSWSLTIALRKIPFVARLI